MGYPVQAGVTGKNRQNNQEFLNTCPSCSSQRDEAKRVAVCDSDHVCLQVGEGRQVEEVLDEVGWRRLAQPQEQGVSVLQQERSRVAQTLLRAAQRSRQSLTTRIHVVLESKIL